METRNDVIINEDVTYSGQFIKGTDIKHGRGVEQNMNGATYTGWFVNDKYGKRGRYVDEYLNFYEGSWLNGLMHGQGKFKWLDGRMYVGSFY